MLDVRQIRKERDTSFLLLPLGMPTKKLRDYLGNFPLTLLNSAERPPPSRIGVHMCVYAYTGAIFFTFPHFE